VVNGALEYLAKDLGIAQNTVLQGFVLLSFAFDSLYFVVANKFIGNEIVNILQILFLLIYFFYSNSFLLDLIFYIL
jgi:predicted RecB family endonuclease